MRTGYCGALNKSNIGETVTLCGWVDRRRDHGGVIFIDLRDREGIAQVVFDPDCGEHFNTAERLRSEYVIRVTGEVRARDENAVNANMKTGEIEVFARELTILNSAETVPFPLDEHNKVGEEVRLKYRYLDLRRPEMLGNLKFRSRVISAIRSYLDQRGFMDVETPMLTRATPEGARDYLVPSRTHEHKFFALPQSPQLFKQLLMMSGVDRYYQIVKCFRDEDLRADRQPEFTQLDMEFAFIEEDGVMDLSEDMVRSVFRDLKGVELDQFPRMPFSEAMEKYGSDKPDLRIPLELVEIKDLVKDVDFKVFSGPANDPKGRVAALKVPRGGEKLARKKIDAYGKLVSTYGARAWPGSRSTTAATWKTACSHRLPNSSRRM